MPGFDDKKFIGRVAAIARSAIEVPRQAEPAARHQATVIAGAVKLLSGGFQFFHAQPRQCFTSGAVAKAQGTRVFIRFDEWHVTLLVHGRH